MRFCLNHYLVKNVSFLRSLPARGVWIEIMSAAICGAEFLKSLPARGVWIEIARHPGSVPPDGVAPRKGSVD